MFGIYPTFLHTRNPLILFALRLTTKSIIMCKLIIKNLTKLLLLLLSLQTIVNGQNLKNFTGTLQDQTTGKAIPFASVVLLKSSDSKQLAGTMSNINGNFTLQGKREKATHIKISHLTYHDTLISASDLVTNKNDTAIILLKSNAVVCKEITISAEAIKGKSAPNGTTYLINEALKKHSTSAIDIVKRLPGIQMDFAQNLKTQSRGEILLTVDGKIHDISYLRQLPAQKINKIKINHHPGARYGGDVGTVVSITLKASEKGFSGQVYSEIPTSESIIYMFPKLSFNFAKKNYNFAIAYNGKLNYFDLLKEDKYKVTTSETALWIKNEQYLRQKTWSHNFSYSTDLQLDKKRLSFFGSYTPYSQELDGKISAHDLNAHEKIYHAIRKDHDINHQLYNSINYQQNFSNETKLTTNLQHGYYMGIGSITYDSINGTNLSNSMSRPYQQTLRFNADLEVSFLKHLKMKLGVKSYYNQVNDYEMQNFSYQSTITGSYAECMYNRGKLNISAGSRVEFEHSNANQKYKRREFTFLPAFAFNFKINKEQNLQLQYSKSIQRPYRYQLNPVISNVNLFESMGGNSQLNNQLNHNLTCSYHLTRGSDYYAFKLFYTQQTNVISQITKLDNSNLPFTTYKNAGNVSRYGATLNTAVKIFKNLTIYGNFALYNISTSENRDLKPYVSENNSKAAFDISVSALFKLPGQFTSSLQFQYVSAQKHIQRITTADPLFFASIEKHFKNNFKIGITGAVPFGKKLSFSGQKVEGAQFTQNSQGYILFNKLPVWLKVTYNFSAGKKIAPGKHKIRATEEIKQKGF